MAPNIVAVVGSPRKGSNTEFLTRIALDNVEQQGCTTELISLRGKKVRGWTVQTMNNACGISFWKWNPPGSAWYAQHLWEHFAFGRDTEYLRNTAYPVLKEVCQFWDDRLSALKTAIEKDTT